MMLLVLEMTLSLPHQLINTIYMAFFRFSRSLLFGVVWRPAAMAFSGTCQKCKISVLILELLDQNLQFYIISR